MGQSLNEKANPYHPARKLGCYPTRGPKTQRLWMGICGTKTEADPDKLLEVCLWSGRLYLVILALFWQSNQLRNDALRAQPPTHSVHLRTEIKHWIQQLALDVWERNEHEFISSSLSLFACISWSNTHVRVRNICLWSTKYVGVCLTRYWV